MIKKFVFVLLIVLFFGIISAQGSSFDVDNPLIKGAVRAGESITDRFIVSNSGSFGEFSVEVDSKSEFISVDKKSFVLGSKAQQDVSVSLDSKGLREGVYIGRVLVHKDGVSKSVPIILEVESRNLLFDTASELPSNTLSIFPGGDLEVDLRVFNLRSPDKKVSLNYVISDFEGNIIFSDTQDLEVERRIQLFKIFEIPRYLELGNYVFYVVVSSGDRSSIGASSFMFSVSDRTSLAPGTSFSPLILSSFVFVFVAAFFILNYLWSKTVMTNSKNWKNRVNEIKKVKFGPVAKRIRKLEYQKTMLETAFKKKYISKSSYDEGVREINKLVIRLKKRL